MRARTRLDERSKRVRALFVWRRSLNSVGRSGRLPGKWGDNARANERIASIGDGLTGSFGFYLRGGEKEER